MRDTNLICTIRSGIQAHIQLIIPRQEAWHDSCISESSICKVCVKSQTCISVMTPTHSNVRPWLDASVSATWLNGIRMSDSFGVTWFMSSTCLQYAVSHIYIRNTTVTFSNERHDTSTWRICTVHFGNLPKAIHVTVRTTKKIWILVVIKNHQTTQFDVLYWRTMPEAMTPWMFFVWDCTNMCQRFILRYVMSGTVHLSETSYVFRNLYTYSSTHNSINIYVYVIYIHTYVHTNMSAYSQEKHIHIYICIHTVWVHHIYIQIYVNIQELIH